MEFPAEIEVKSEMETSDFAKNFAAYLHPKDIVFLNGELGSGKTFFVKSICAEFGIQNVTSPSFAIVNQYKNSKKITHFDFYRIKKLEELYDIGIEDYLEDDESIIFIEWAELFPGVLPKKNYQVEFNMINDSVRKIKIQKNG